MDVLIIEDNPDDALLAGRALQSMARVSYARSGVEGVDKALRQPCDALVLDYRLGDLPGSEVLARVRAKRPEMPVVVTSGMGGHFIVARLLALGATEFVTKGAPDFEARLQNAIRSAAARKPQAALEQAWAPAAGESSPRVAQVRRIMQTLLDSCEIVQTIGIVGSKGATIHGRVQDTSGAQDVTAVLASTVHSMLLSASNHLGYGGTASVVAAFQKGLIGVAPLPAGLTLYATSKSDPKKAEALRAELEAVASELVVALGRETPVPGPAGPRGSRQRSKD